MNEKYQPTSAITLQSDDAETVTLRLRLTRPTPEHKIQAIVLLLYVTALAAAIYGCTVLSGVEGVDRSESRELANGASILAASFLLWLLAELIDNWQPLRRWWGRHDRLGKALWLARVLPLLAALNGLRALSASMSAPPETVLDLILGALASLGLAALLLLLIAVAERWLRRRRDMFPSLAGWIDENMPRPPQVVAPLSFPRLLSLRSISFFRILLLLMAAFSSAAVWVNTTDNSFPPPVFGLWVVSTLLWALALAPRDKYLFLRLYSGLNRDWVIPWRRYWWAYIAFALIMIVGIHFRLTNLDLMPPEISGGPFLNLKDAYNLSHGNVSPVYFLDNGGRPILAFYLVAALAAIPGLGFDYYTLKLSTALSSVIALPVMLWLGVAFAGSLRRNFGIVTGLLLAGFVAASHWDVALSRIGYDFVLPVFCSALLAVFLIRAIRHNRRADFIMAGLALGFSLYTYQPARAFPLVVVAAVLIALALRQISWRERLAYLVNLAVLAFVSFMVFLPMFHFMLESPDKFWQRFNETTDLHTPSAEEVEMSAFEEYVSRAMPVVRKHLLMYHWAGDSDWSRGGIGVPTLSAIAGGLLVLGLAALAARLARSRDPVLWALPAIILVMHVPAIIVVEHHIQYSVPSHTRTLGALPYVYLLAAFPLALIARQFQQVFPKAIAPLLVILLCGGLLLHSYQQNHRLYFGRHYKSALTRLDPASEGGKIIRGFVDSGGAYGNAFIIHGHGAGEARFVAMEAGAWNFPNEIYNLSQITNLIFDASGRDDYQLDADRDLLFLYTPHNDEATDTLRSLFPQGYSQVIPSNRRKNHQYAVYRVRALGADGLYDFLLQHAKG